MAAIADEDARPQVLVTVVNCRFLKPHDELTLAAVIALESSGIQTPQDLAGKTFADAQTAAGARKWNDANVLALSLRTTSEALLGEILDAWFAGEPSDDPSDAENVRHLEEIS